MVRRPVEGAQLLVDAARGEAVRRLRRQQQMVDADAEIAVPRARLVIPERVEGRLVRGEAQRVGQAEREERAVGLAGAVRAAGEREREGARALLARGGVAASPGESAAR